MAWKFVLIAVSKKVTFFENFKTNNSHNNEQRDNWSFLYIFFFSWITETGFAICKTDLLIMWGRKEEKKKSNLTFPLWRLFILGTEFKTECYLCTCLYGGKIPPNQCILR